MICVYELEFLEDVSLTKSVQLWVPVWINWDCSDSGTGLYNIILYVFFGRLKKIEAMKEMSVLSKNSMATESQLSADDHPLSPTKVARPNSRHRKSHRVPRGWEFSHVIITMFKVAAKCYRHIKIDFTKHVENSSGRALYLAQISASPPSNNCLLCDLCQQVRLTGTIFQTTIPGW